MKISLGCMSALQSKKPSLANTKLIPSNLPSLLQCTPKTVSLRNSLPLGLSMAAAKKLSMAIWFRRPN